MNVSVCMWRSAGLWRARARGFVGLWAPPRISRDWWRASIVRLLSRAFRTFNRNCTGECIGTDKDWTKFNPWRAPGSAPVYDPCGRAGGGPNPTGGKGEYTDTKFATFGQLGSTLPKQPSGVTWKAGDVVETLWSVRANHGGGWQFRLCPLGSELTEDCFQQTPMPFARDSRMMMSNGTMLNLTSTFVSEGTSPEGSTWQMLVRNKSLLSHFSWIGVCPLYYPHFLPLLFRAPSAI
jgi:hypothetical protein